MATPVILIIDDDKMLCEMLSRKLRKMDCTPVISHTVTQGMEMAARVSPEVIFLDVMLPDGSGLDILPRLKALPSAPEVIIFTARGTKDGAELAIRTGAWDYIAKPSSLKGMIRPLTRALQYRKKTVGHNRASTLNRDGIVGKSPRLESCLAQVAEASGSDASVLIRGETGTGKEKIALATHLNSQRRHGPFIAVDCAALTRTLAAGQLFGHVRGAFTGATADQPGFLKQADQGTVFFDEVGELPSDLQKIFLRALQEKQFMPLGAKKTVKSDFRVIAATNRDLEKMASQSRFREDLLFRLKTFHIQLPALRERAGDIEELARHFLKEISSRPGSNSKEMAPSFVSALNKYQWPGNVRELINTMERSLAAAGPTPTLYPQHLPNSIRIAIAAADMAPPAGPSPLSTAPATPATPSPPAETPLPSLQEIRDRTDRQYLNEILAYTNGDIKEMGKISGMSRSRLYALLKKHGLVRRS